MLQRLFFVEFWLAECGGKSFKSIIKQKHVTKIQLENAQISSFLTILPFCSSPFIYHFSDRDCSFCERCASQSLVLGDFDRLIRTSFVEEEKKTVSANRLVATVCASIYLYYFCLLFEVISE